MWHHLPSSFADERNHVLLVEWFPMRCWYSMLFPVSWSRAEKAYACFAMGLLGISQVEVSDGSAVGA